MNQPKVIAPPREVPKVMPAPSTDVPAPVPDPFKEPPKVEPLPKELPKEVPNVNPPITPVPPREIPKETPPETPKEIPKELLGLVEDVLLDRQIPMSVAPAMNTSMWHHPATLRNLQQLRADGVHIIEPDEGEMACGTIGPGRLSEPDSELLRTRQESLAVCQENRLGRPESLAVHCAEAEK